MWRIASFYDLNGIWICIPFGISIHMLSFNTIERNFFPSSSKNSYESMNKSIVIFYSQSCRIKAYVVKTTSFELKKKYKSLWHVQWAALRQRFISQKFLLLITSTERNIRKYLHAHFTIVLQNIQSSQAHKLKQTAK